MKKFVNTFILFSAVTAFSFLTGCSTQTDNNKNTEGTTVESVMQAPIQKEITGLSAQNASSNYDDVLNEYNEIEFYMKDKFLEEYADIGKELESIKYQIPDDASSQEEIDEFSNNLKSIKDKVDVIAIQTGKWTAQYSEYDAALEFSDDLASLRVKADDIDLNISGSYTVNPGELIINSNSEYKNIYYEINVYDLIIYVDNKNIELLRE